MEQSRETVDRPASFLRRKYDLFTKSFFHLLLILNDLYEKKDSEMQIYSQFSL